MKTLASKQSMFYHKKMNQKHIPLVGKQQHVLQTGAPPHEFIYLYRLFPLNLISFTTESIFKGFQALDQVIISIFKDSMSPFTLDAVGPISVC